MRGGRMDLLWRIVAAFSFNCFKDSSSSSRSPPRLSWSPAGSLESSSLTGSVSLGLDLPLCQSCISHDARLKRLSCGHMYCDSCCHHIVNQAFQDIEGLSDFPCPLCKTLRQLGGPGESPLGGPGVGALGLSSLGGPGGPDESCSLLQQQQQSVWG